MINIKDIKIQRNIAICIAVAALSALVAYYWWEKVHIYTDSPILVRDGGSMVLESPEPNSLASFDSIGRYEIRHRITSGRMRSLILPDGSVVACRQLRRCGMVVTYDDARNSTLRITTGPVGRAMSVISSVGFPFTPPPPLPPPPVPPQWDKSSSVRWTAGDLSMQIVSITTFGTVNDVTVPCISRPCRATGRYEY